MGKELLAWILSEASGRLPQPWAPNLDMYLAKVDPISTSGGSCFESSFVLERREPERPNHSNTKVSEERVGEAIWSSHYLSSCGEMAG